jgi:hypothetical protein
MGKHKHSKDKMFISYSEHKSDWGVIIYNYFSYLKLI